MAAVRPSLEEGALIKPATPAYGATMRGSSLRALEIRLAALPTSEMLWKNAKTLAGNNKNKPVNSF
jgi:hypothetical protein